MQLVHPHHRLLSLPARSSARSGGEEHGQQAGSGRLLTYSVPGVSPSTSLSDRQTQFLRIPMMRKTKISSRFRFPILRHLFYFSIVSSAESNKFNIPSQNLLLFTYSVAFEVLSSEFDASKIYCIVESKKLMSSGKDLLSRQHGR